MTVNEKPMPSSPSQPHLEMQQPVSGAQAVTAHSSLGSVVWSVGG